jgi:SNF2 family DNA or RNA helicase
VKEYGTRLPELFPNLIIDESSKLENPSTKGFKALEPLLPLFKWRLPMTGTPRANHLHDLWGNVYLADLGNSLGVYKQAFLQFFFVQVQRRVGTAWLPKHDAEAQIYFRMKCFNAVYRMPFEWQKPVEIDINLPINPRVKALQGNIDAALKHDLDVTIDGVTYARGGNRVAAKMFQLSSGFIYKDDHTVDHLHSDKMNALVEIVDEAKGEPVMVVYQFDHERDAILERFPYARLLDGAATLEEWNDGKIPMLVVHPLSCGHGLNAQLGGCDMQVWFSPTVDAELYGQTVGRLNRPGNPKTIRVFRLIMQGTKDRAAYMVVAARQRGEHLTLEAFE